jgi:hypothetical protein
MQAIINQWRRLTCIVNRRNQPKRMIVMTTTCGLLLFVVGQTSTNVPRKTNCGILYLLILDTETICRRTNRLRIKMY